MAKIETDDKPEKEGKTEEPIQLTAVVTGTAPAFKLPNGDVVGLEDYLVWLGNLVYHIRKNTG